MQRESDPISKLIYDNKLDPKKHKGFMSPEEGIHKMRTEFFAFQIESSPAYYIIQKTFEEDEKCGIDSKITYLKMSNPYLSCARGSPFTDQFRVM